MKEVPRFNFIKGLWNLRKRKQWFLKKGLGEFLNRMVKALDIIIDIRPKGKPRKKDN
jgi:hypothetical protein